jgi:hypothetical protein
MSKRTSSALGDIPEIRVQAGKALHRDIEEIQTAADHLRIDPCGSMEVC